MGQISAHSHSNGKLPGCVRQGARPSVSLCQKMRQRFVTAARDALGKAGISYLGYLDHPLPGFSSSIGQYYQMHHHYGLSALGCRKMLDRTQSTICLHPGQVSVSPILF